MLRLAFAATLAVALLFAASPLSVCADALDGYGLLAATPGVTNAGFSVVCGNLGVYPGSTVTHFPPGKTTNGAVHGTPDALNQEAQLDAAARYRYYSGLACDVTGVTALGGLSLLPGTYCSATSMSLVGSLILNSTGQSNPVWAFISAGAISFAAESTIVTVGGYAFLHGCTATWTAGADVTLGLNAVVLGSIYATGSISLAIGATVSGRAVALTGAISLLSSRVGCGCSITNVTASASSSSSTGSSP